MEFNLVDIRIHISCNNPLQLQHTIMLHGPSRYPQYCRESVCYYPGKDCLACKCRNECQYHLIFRQELATDPEAIKKHQKPPLPFAFSFPETRIHNLVCRLVIVGNGISSLEMLLEGFTALITNSYLVNDCSIEEITSLDYQGLPSILGTERHLLKHRDNVILLSSNEIFNKHQNENECTSIKLTTPLKLLTQGRINHNFSFKQFVSSVMRRVSSIGYYYADYEFDVDYRELSLLAEKVTGTSGSFTFNTLNGVQLSGITGEGIFTGIKEDLLQFLLIGSFLNTGKGASFGFGGYKSQ